MIRLVNKFHSLNKWSISSLSYMTYTFTFRSISHSSSRVIYVPHHPSIPNLEGRRVSPVVTHNGGTFIVPKRESVKVFPTDHNLNNCPLRVYFYYFLQSHQCHWERRHRLGSWSRRNSFYKLRVDVLSGFVYENHPPRSTRSPLPLWRHSVVSKSLSSKSYGGVIVRFSHTSYDPL